MKRNRILAVLCALSIAAASAAVPSFASETDVNVAFGKYVTSSKFGGGSWDGGDATVDALVDGGKQIYVSPLPEYGTDVITIDLLGDYTVTGVQVDTYGNDDPSDSFYIGNGGNIKVTAKKTKSDAGVELTRKMNGESGYFPYSGGGYHSDFDISGSEKYRYIVITYTEGAGAVDMRMPEVKVFAPASEANNEASRQVAPVSFLKPVTAGCGATWGSVEGVTDRTVTKNFYAYGRVDGEAWVAIDLGCAYPIKMVVPDMQVGGVSAVIVSNNSDFADSISLVSDTDGKWMPNSSVTGMYRYVKVIPTVAQSSATDTTLSTAYKEVFVYSTFEAKEDIGELTDVAPASTLSTNGYDAFWPLANAVDGNESTAAGIYGASSSKYIQADLGRGHDIKRVSILNATDYGWQGTGKVRTIQLSNDPNFGTYEEMTLSKRVLPHDHADYVDYKSEWTYAGGNVYRYVRLWPTTGSTEYVNYGSDTAQSFVMKEMNIYVTGKSVELTNVIANRAYTGGSWYSDLTGEKLVDGNNDTIAAGTSFALFELDHPAKIERVELDLRKGMVDSDNDRRYDVYLSNTGTKEGALKIISSEEPQAAVENNTIIVPVDSDVPYKYILIGAESNFWVLSEARVMSTNAVPKYTVIYNYSQNGGASATETSASVRWGNNADLSVTAEKAGWDFVGWNTDANATEALSSYTVTDNVTLYAIFEEQEIEEPEFTYLGIEEETEDGKFRKGFAITAQNISGFNSIKVTAGNSDDAVKGGYSLAGILPQISGEADAQLGIQINGIPAKYSDSIRVFLSQDNVSNNKLKED